MNVISHHFITMLQNANFACKITDPMIPSAICTKKIDHDNPRQYNTMIEFKMTKWHIRVNGCQRGKRCITRMDSHHPVEISMPDTISVGVNYDKSMSALSLYDHVQVIISAYGKKNRRSYIELKPLPVE